MTRKSLWGLLWLMAMGVLVSPGVVGAASLGDADYDGDGKLGLTDYNGWVADGGDSDTLTVWKENFGADVPSPALLTTLGGALPAADGPTASAIGIRDGEFINWTVYFTPDESGFYDPPDDNPDRGVGGSLAVNFSYEMPAGSLIPSSVMLLAPFDEFDDFPGDDPYQGDFVEGIQTYQSTTAKMTAGLVDAIFLPAGSEFLTEAVPAPAMKFTTTADGDMLTFGGLVAQEIPGTSGEFMLAPQTVGAVPEPGTALILGLAVGLAAVAYRRR
ncbi:PEP-CTERM sorting domain-containing protein [Aeoliella sp.]|uniref:PEP-CTERM sorting domain-containing protein n=1 Tax=Aeoliella sp. TaxID=2795800 RepID=UPI003CCC415A